MLSNKSSFVLFFEYLMNSFACLCPGVLFQYEALVLASQAEILDSHFLLVIPQYGSGPTRFIEAPALARKTAFSLPSTPWCPGVHHRWTSRLLTLASGLRLSSCCVLTYVQFIVSPYPPRLYYQDFQQPNSKSIYFSQVMWPAMVDCFGALSHTCGKLGLTS